MKKICLIIVFITSCFALPAQVDLKGIKLGELFSSEMSLAIKPETLGGIDGNLCIIKINDGRVYRLSWGSESKYNIVEKDVNLFVNGIKAKYHISNFRKSNINSSTNRLYYKDDNLGVEYTITVRIVQDIIIPTYSIMLDITNIKLAGIAEKELKFPTKEEQKKANLDF